MAYTVYSVERSLFSRLRWEKNVIPVTVSSSLVKNLNIKSESDVLGAIRRSFEVWEKAADIEFRVTWSEKQSVSPPGKTGDGVSLITVAQTPENLLLFSGDTGETAARTRTFFNRRGIITESDIVLNPFAQFSTDGTAGMFDLEATLTHEIGHLLGLEHSSVIGATMFEHQGKNGIYSLPNFSPRTLAEDDVSRIRALYGVKTADENCCGSISGKLSFSTGKSAEGFQVWAEDVASGRVLTGILTGADGSFHLEGLPVGKYRVFAQERLKKGFSAVLLGDFAVEKDKNIQINERISLKRKNFDFQYIGFNGQISELAVPVNSGKAYQIFVAGKNLDFNQLKVKFSSPYFSVTPNSFTKHNYGPDLSVFSFEIKVTENAQVGEYSFSLESKNGASDYAVGSVIVEETVNSWYSSFFE